MTLREQRIADLISDPACVALMARDGVRARDVLTLMLSVRPLVVSDASYRRLKEQKSLLAA